MTYEPHTERLGPDDRLELPPHARGVSVARDGDAYVVHYLALTEETKETRREERRERVQEIREQVGLTAEERDLEVRG